MASVMRISDLDRELAARRLCDAAGVGILGVSELEWRLDRVLSAATRGQLEALPVGRPRSAHRAGIAGQRWLRAHLGAFVIVNSGLAAIWAAAGFGYLWPVWPLIGWGMVISGHAWAAHLADVAAERDLTVVR